MSGGGGNKTETKQTIPNELKPLATAYANKAMDLGTQGYNPYYGERFAGQNWVQDSGNQAAIRRAANGDPTINAGANYLRGQLGEGERSATANPNGDVSATANPNGGVSAERNQYQGQNPYLDHMVGKAQDSVRSQFNTGAVSSGSFGNSGLQEQFQKGLSDTATQMYGADYANTQQLAEAGINRNLQAQQFNSQMGNDWAQRNDQAQQFNSQMGNNWAQRNDQVRQSQDANQLSAAQLGQQYGNQAYMDADQMRKAGQVYQDQGQQQLDFNYQQFQDQENLPYKQLAAMGGVFGTNMGGSSSTKGGGGK